VKDHLWLLGASPWSGGSILMMMELGMRLFPRVEVDVVGAIDSANENQHATYKQMR
jgi:hypothetical protein